MNKFAIGAVFVASLLIPVFSANSQEQSSKEEPQLARPAPEGPQLKVRVVFSEYDGDKKVKSLPYALLVRIARTEADHDGSKIRIGSRVPVLIGGDKGSNQIQYLDVGTNIDCFAHKTEEGNFRLTLYWERSWVETEPLPVGGQSPGSTLPEKTELAAHTPIIRQFRADGGFTLRDGQTLETNFATDPVTGKVIRLEVAVNTMK
jgi:hypothetical protein